MYKRHTEQVSMLESPEMFGSLLLNPNNNWIKLSKVGFGTHLKMAFVQFTLLMIYLFTLTMADIP